MKMISSIASFKTRLMIANGIFCSKLIFQICLWGGSEEYLLNALQIVQNKAARFVTRRSKYTPIVELLNQCGWLSVKQLVFYHGVILIYKTIKTTYPSTCLTSSPWTFHIIQGLLNQNLLEWEISLSPSLI